MSRPLDPALIERIVGAVKMYSGMNLQTFISRGALRFYSYSRSYEKKHHTSPLAFSKYRGKLYVQPHMIGLFTDEDCLAFVILHEVGHLVGNRREKDATNFANLWLGKGKVLSPRRIAEINRGWRKARRTGSVVKRKCQLGETKVDQSVDDDDLYEMALIDLLSCPDSPCSL